MIRKKVAALIVIIIGFIFQTNIFQHLELANVAPNVLLVITISYAYLRGRTSGLFIGFFCGLLLDMYCGTVVGLYAFILMTIGFLVGFCQKYYYTDSMLLPCVLILVGDFVYSIYYYVAEFLMRGRLNFGYAFIHVILPELIYTALVGIVIYRLLKGLDNLLTKSRRESYSD